MEDLFKALDNVADIFRSLDPMLQGFWILALVSSVFFLMQTVSIFIGYDADDPGFGGDADFDSEGFQIVSIKTIICFILGFGWTGVLFWHTIGNRLLIALLAFFVGLAFMLIIAFLLRWVTKLDRDNTFNIEKTVGHAAKVYLRIPAKRADTGKVLVSLDGSMHELEALTDDIEPIPTGGSVVVVSTIKDSIVLVKQI